MSTAHDQDQLDNAGFEQWEEIWVSDVDAIREPVEWSSVKTSDTQVLSDLAPVVCKRGSDAHSGEYSIEIDPREVNRESIKLLRDIGFNRMSLGVQDFNHAVQKAVNRIQSEEPHLTVMCNQR